jgi:hypothetical protein
MSSSLDSSKCLGLYVFNLINLDKETCSLYQVLTAIVTLLWIVVAVGTMKGSLTGKMFYAPCLTTDMKLKERKLKKIAEMAER